MKNQNLGLKEKPPYINMEKISNQIYMRNIDLEKFSKSELIELVHHLQK